MKYKTALIGCGRIGFLLEKDPLRYKPCTHFGGATLAGLPITHACDINEQRLALFAQYSGISPSHCFTNYEELLHTVKPHCVIIASWTHTHAPIGIAAALSGAKVIVCEKPIAENIQKAKELLDVCTSSGTTLIINHERRYDYKYRYVKKLLQRNYIGTVQSVHGFVFTPSKTHQKGSGGGPLLHDGTHLIDIIQFLFGDIISISGYTRKYSQHSIYEDYAIAHGITQTGVHISIEAGGYRDFFMFELRIYGTKGSIVIGNGYLEIYTPKKSRLYTGFKDLVPRTIVPPGKPDYFIKLYKEAKRCIAHRITVTSRGEDGYKALQVIDAIYTSSNNNGSIITIKQ